MRKPVGYVDLEPVTGSSRAVGVRRGAGKRDRIPPPPREGEIESRGAREAELQAELKRLRERDEPPAAMTGAHGEIRVRCHGCGTSRPAPPGCTPQVLARMVCNECGRRGPTLMDGYCALQFPDMVEMNRLLERDRARAVPRGTRKSA